MLSVKSVPDSSSYVKGASATVTKASKMHGLEPKGSLADAGIHSSGRCRRVRHVAQGFGAVPETQNFLRLQSVVDEPKRSKATRQDGTSLLPRA